MSGGSELRLVPSPGYGLSAPRPGLLLCKFLTHLLLSILRSAAMEITSSHNAAHLLRPLMDPSAEEFWALALTSTKTVISARCLFRGTVDSCLVHPRDIFRFACLANASSILIAHNHPSGDPLPSCEDIRLTQRLRRASRLMEIPLIDHLIITNREHTSFLEARWFQSLGRST